MDWEPIASVFWFPSNTSVFSFFCAFFCLVVVCLLFFWGEVDGGGVTEVTEKREGRAEGWFEAEMERGRKRERSKDVEGTLVSSSLLCFFLLLHTS